MKSKKFFILALAAAVLFAFAACQAGSVSYSDINTISVAQTGTILVGQEPTAAAFTITGDFNGTAKEVQGKITKQANNTVEASVEVLTFGNLHELKATTSYEYTPIESLTFSGIDTAYTFAQGADAKTDIQKAVTAFNKAIADGTCTIVINDAIDIADVANLNVYDITIGLETEDGILTDDAIYTELADPDNIGTEYAVVMIIAPNTPDAFLPMNATTNITVTMTEEPEEPVVTTTGIEVLYTVLRNGSPVTGLNEVTSLSAGDVYLDDVVRVKVIKTLSDGSKNDLQYSTAVGKDNFQATGDITFSGTEKYTDITVTANAVESTVYYHTSDLASTQSKEVSIPAGEDSLTGTPTFKQAAGKVGDGTPIIPDNIEYVVAVEGLSWLSSDVVDRDDYTLTLDTSRTYWVTASEPADVYFTLTYEEYGVEKSVYAMCTIKQQDN